MNIKTQNHKDFIRLLISLFLISVFFFVMITSSAQASTFTLPRIAPTTFVPRTVHYFYNIEKANVNDIETLDYLLANQDLFLDYNSRGFVFSDTMNAHWLEHKLTSVSA